MILFTLHVFVENLRICLYASFSFGFEGGMWHVIVLIPDHCLSIYFQSLPAYHFLIYLKMIFLTFLGTS